jgi:hypothetical protein
LDGLIGGMDWRDGLEGWIGGMDWRDGQIKGWRDVVLLYLFYFREKRNFRIFVKNPFSRKAKFSHFRGFFSRKTKMIFVRIFAKIYFRPNCTPALCPLHGSWFPVQYGTMSPLPPSVNFLAI